MISSSVRGFLAPLQAERRWAWLLVSVVVLSVVKIYEGDQAFFVKHFSEPFTDVQELNWMKWLYHHLASLVLFFAIPLIIIRFALHERGRAFGLGLGDWKFGIKASLVALLVLPIPVYFSSLNPEHRDFYLSGYPLELANSSVLYFALWGLTYLPHYIGWEFFYRGYIGFGFKKHMGMLGALMFQTLLTALMHIGKPEGETWGAVVGGIYLGLLAYRTRSIWYGVLFHFYLGILNSWFCAW
ncbi:MAG: CPBP family intramembrane metalloprotease [Leptolyngbya sp. SIO3F4]|nr:CPBP family intramembrane metalloprotease [Leptolyngbya sp. SIO3F4]